MAQNKPKVLLWDLENTPSLGFVWGKYDQTVVEFKDDWYILSVAWKWLGEPKTHVLALSDFPNYRHNKKDDKQLCLKIRELLDEADIVIAHNGDAFDMKKAHARMMIHGIEPHSPVRSIDTLKIARRTAMFTSNKLGDLGTSLGVGTKVDAGGINTWLGCMGLKHSESTGQIVNCTPEEGTKAWRLMKRYNKADVDLLESVYLRMMPFAPTLPNTTLITEVPDSCPRPGCGAVGQMWRRGKERVATTRVYDVYQCQACKGYSSVTRSTKGVHATYKPV